MLSGYAGSSAHAGSRTWVASMGGLYDAATLRELLISLRGDVKTPRTVLVRARSTAASRRVPHARGPGSMPGRAPRVPQLFAWRLRRLWSLGCSPAVLSPQELLLSGYPGSSAHAGSRTRVTSMGGLYDAATLRALTFAWARRKYSCSILPEPSAMTLSGASLRVALH